MANIVKEVVYSNTTHDIRIAPELSATFPCLVTNTGITADAEGRKILKAGTPIGAGAAIAGTNDVLLKRDQVLVKDTSYAQGVILHDTDVTAGATNATIMVAGYVDYLKLDSTVQTMVDTAYMTTTPSGGSATNTGNAVNANIKFIKGRA